MNNTPAPARGSLTAWLQQHGRHQMAGDGRKVGNHFLVRIDGMSSSAGWEPWMRASGLAAAISPRATRTWPAIRVLAMVGYGVGFVAQCLWWGWPTDTLLIFGWLSAGALCWNTGQPWHGALRWARDWGPVLGLLMGYDYSRGVAAHGLAPHVTAMIRADELLAGGRLPTLWLQQHLYDPRRVHWWDVLASVVYLSHFLAVPGVAALLWLCRRQMWSAFVRRWLCLTIAGVATYLAFPAAPPWWASVHGYLGEHVERLSARGWAGLGLDSTGPLFDQGRVLANPIAAMPSLHAAFSLFLAVFFLPRVSRRWRLPLLAYPLAMTFTVLYCAEHYLVDVLAGWGYVLATFALVGVGERWWQRNIGGTDRGRHRRQPRRTRGHHRRVVLTGPRSSSPVLAAGVGNHADQALAEHSPQGSDSWDSKPFPPDLGGFRPLRYLDRHNAADRAFRAIDHDDNRRPTPVRPRTTTGATSAALSTAAATSGSIIPGGPHQGSFPLAHHYEQHDITLDNKAWSA